jgi:hypothetical protein
MGGHGEEGGIRAVIHVSKISSLFIYFPAVPYIEKKP